MQSNFSKVDVVVPLSWPTGMIPDASMTVMPLKDAKRLLLGQFSADRAEGATAASERDAVACHVASKFWIENVKKTNAMAEFSIKLNNKVAVITSLRGSSNASLANVNMSSRLLVDRAIHAAIDYLNTDVVNRFKDVHIMTPLARVAITDNNIKALADHFESEPSDIVKMFNVATSRKAQQFDGNAHYQAELALACLIRSSFNQTASSITRSIGMRQMAKISNTAGIKGIDQDLVSEYLTYMNSPDNIKADVDKILEQAKKMRTLSLDKRTTARGRLYLSSITPPDDDIDELADSLNSKLNQASGAIKKQNK